MALPKLFHVNEDSPAADWALLAIRILAGLTLFNFSGAPKLFHLSNVMAIDVLSLGGLAPLAMLYAAFALGICTLLVFVGLATRFAAFCTAVSLAATGLFVDHALSLNYLDPGHNSHPEVIWLYFSVYLVLIFTGPGRFSLDKLISRSSHAKQEATA
jgi:putative oxidoreductase